MKKNTKYFANIEKRRSEQKTIHKLEVSGEDITNRTQILEEQRCPLSSSLFIICIEYLSHYIQSNKHIKGISLEPDEEIKQSLFADDATYFLNDSASFNNLIVSLTLYGMASGLKLNKRKCTVLRVTQVSNIVVVEVDFITKFDIAKACRHSRSHIF
ncbi:hypothetical protein DPMN_017309 [Dreissena polymorpha]|uniref:Reverse transcriptase domain-containing protein n=1 Tax=Dreissena polymorpha TaxID=45954 RepID=A0A9D4NEG3_DREPO|nr:hypothetical protein DPMN_017309 [Dreissena polymorpha]